MTDFALVCRHWREAVRLALGLTTWNFIANYKGVGRHTPRFLKLRAALQTLPVVESDLRLFDDAAAPLLLEPAVVSKQAATLRSATMQDTESNLSKLASSYPHLESLCLLECPVRFPDPPGRYTSYSRMADMLGCLHRLRRLQLEGGVVDLAALPPQVRELKLLSVDRLVLPPGARGEAVTDRLLDVAEARGGCCGRVGRVSGGLYLTALCLPYALPTTATYPQSIYPL